MINAGSALAFAACQPSVSGVREVTATGASPTNTGRRSSGTGCGAHRVITGFFAWNGTAGFQCAVVAAQII